MMAPLYNATRHEASAHISHGPEDEPVSPTEKLLPSPPLLGVLAIAILAVTACGASATPEPTTAPEAMPVAEPAGAEGPAIRHPDRTFALDDLIAAGWKNSKQLDAEALPGAIEVSYGFYNQKDIEVRVYASHKDVLESGVGPAEEAAKESYASDFFKGSAPNYSAYVVLGNMVLMCQFSVADCDDLIAQIE